MPLIFVFINLFISIVIKLMLVDSHFSNIFDHYKSEIKLSGNSSKKSVHIIYFMDPICSSCWSMESHIRKLILSYGEHFSIEFKMGGLLEKLSDGDDKQKMITDIAKHWNQMDQNVTMPIDGDLWLEDPISSSYPPSIAYKSAFLQDTHKAMNFLRAIREMVFLFKKNITKWDVIEPAVISAGLDPELLRTDFEGRGKDAFEQDLEIAKQFSINWFPTMFFITEKGLEEMVSGPRNFAFYENLLFKLNPEIQRSNHDWEIEELFNIYSSYTTGELAEISDRSKEYCQNELDRLVNESKIEKMDSKNGPLWKKK